MTAEPVCTDQRGMLPIAGRSVTVGVTPLPATPATFCTTRLARPGPGRLTVTPNLGAAPWLLAGALAAASAVPVLAALGLPPPGAAYAPFILWPLSLFFGLACGERLLLVPGFDFDLGRRHVRYRIRLTRRRRTLDAILAVQVLPGVVYRSDEGLDYRQYQLNLVLDDAGTPRLNVSNHADLARTREIGRQLAELLNVPLLDQVPVVKK